jgi:hypothetical protein
VTRIPEAAPEIEQEKFAGLQAYLLPQFHEVFPSRTHEQTVVVVPSLSFDMDVLAKITGNAHYEERLLCMLMLLRWPKTKVVYLTSVPIHPSIVDYYLHLLPGIPTSHARRRLTLLSCHDDASRPLTEKLLARPRLLQRIRDEASNPRTAHISCFMSTPLERTLATRLGLPLYGCDPLLSHLGDKSHGREIMREAGVRIADGFEHLRDETDMAEALTALKARNPDLERAVTKLNEGFSGEGNAVFSFDQAPSGSALASWVRGQLPGRLRYEAHGESWVHARPDPGESHQLRGESLPGVRGDRALSGGAHRARGPHRRPRLRAAALFPFEAPRGDRLRVHLRDDA